jgi:hypothetical protein
MMLLERGCASGEGAPNQRSSGCAQGGWWSLSVGLGSLSPLAAVPAVTPTVRSSWRDKAPAVVDPPQQPVPVPAVPVAAAEPAVAAPVRSSWRDKAPAVVDPPQQPVPVPAVPVAAAEPAVAAPVRSSWRDKAPAVVDPPQQPVPVPAVPVPAEPAVAAPVRSSWRDKAPADHPPQPAAAPAVPVPAVEPERSPARSSVARSESDSNSDSEDDIWREHDKVTACLRPHPYASLACASSMRCSERGGSRSQEEEAARLGALAAEKEARAAKAAEMKEALKQARAAAAAQVTACFQTSSSARTFDVCGSERGARSQQEEARLAAEKALLAEEQARAAKAAQVTDCLRPSRRVV